MADETISTRIVADADFSNLIADVHKVTASLSRLQEQLANSNKMLANQVAVMNRSFGDTLRSTGQFSSHFVTLTSDVDKFGKNLDGGRLKLKDYFGTFQQHVKTSGGLIRELARQQVALQNSIVQPLGRNSQGLMQFSVHVPRGLEEIRSKTAIARQELQIMNKVIQDGAVQLINWGKNTQWAGRQLTVGLTVPIAAFGKAAADAFKVADQELTRLTKVYGDIAGSSAAELSKIRQDVSATAKELSAAMGVNFSETIGLAADIAATGKTGNELLSSVAETTRLSVLGEVDRQEAMKATLAIQSAFKQNTTELADSINFLNAVENQTSTTLNDLVEAIPKAGPVIKGLGGSVQDLALYLTAMREGGISASEGANALKSALASLINPTDVAVAKFRSLGIDLLGIVNDNAGNVTGTLLELQSALDRLDPLQKQQAIEQLFGKFQFSRLNALFENLGRQGSQTLQVLDLMKASSADLAQVANRELTAVTESASGRYRRALESLRADLAEVGDQFLNIGTKIINVIGKALEFFNNLPKPIKQALTFLTGLTALAGPLIMLTGVLANFFGYIVKGAMHMRAFFAGGEGWKLLTPEMMAAEKAGKLVEQTFYSDAKAAAILQTALRNLIDEFSILETKAKTGAVSVGPAVSTMAGNLIMGAAGGREVVAGHPLAGAYGTRASTHMVPRSGMTEEQRMAQTIFGLVPGAIPVNRKIGDAPQIYMNQPLPPIPGLTQVGGVSTGVVSGEAARWHAMMATLAMQSKAEIETLKKQIATTGVVSKDFMNQFDDILPVVSGITDKAAQQSALIVAELRAGKINIEQARAQIIALNLEIERMMSSAVAAKATEMGRTINPTVVPTLNQPVVDASGKSNMRELFKKSKTRDLIDKVARSLGVRTSGAGYNIETTRPKKLAMGEVNVKKYANGFTSVAAALKASKLLRAFSAESKKFSGTRTPNMRPGSTSGSSTNKSAEQGVAASYGVLRERKNAIYDDPWLKAAGITPTADGEYLVHGYTPGYYARTRGLEFSKNAARVPANRLGEFGLGHTSTSTPYLEVLPAQFIKNTSTFNNRLGSTKSVLGAYRKVSGQDMVSLLMFLKSQGYNPQQSLAIATRAANVLNAKMLAWGDRPMSEAQFGKILNNASTRAIKSAFMPNMVRDVNPFGRDRFSRNRGLIPNPRIKTELGFAGGVTNLPGYGGGDIIPALLEPGESVITKTATSRNQGALALMNAGYPVDKMLGFQEGVVDAKPKGTGMGSMIGGMGLMYAGQAVGGKAGSIMSSAGMVMQFMPMLQMIPKVNTMLGKLTVGLGAPVKPAAAIAEKLVKTSTGLSGMTRMFGPVLRGLAGMTRMFSPLGIALTVITTAVSFGIKKWKEHQESQRIARLEFGMTADSAKKAGLKYTDYNQRIKDAIENAKVLAERNRMIYESMTMSNTPLKMTIEQYKKLREQVKNTMGDYIKLFDQTDKADVGSLAVRLKSQFMAAGDTAEEATAKIYTLIASSNKSGQAATAISSSAFKGIQTLQDAAEQSIKTFEGALSASDLKGQADSLFAAFSAIDASIADTVAKSEDAAKKNKGNAITVGEAQKQQMDKLNSQFKNQKTLSSGVINEIKKISPELGKALNNTDTLTSAWSKYQLLIRGINVDLSTMSGKAANAAMNIISSVDTLTTSYLKSNGATKALYDKYDNLTAKIKSLQKAAAGQSAKEQIDSRKAIEGLNKKIAKIKEEADAKIKALRSAKQAEDDALNIQKLQLQYQQALARGDRDAAAQAQIDLQQTSGDIQMRKAEERIQANAEKEMAPYQKQIDAINAKNQQLADKAALAGDSLAKLQGDADKLKKNLDDLNSALSRVLINRLLDPTYSGSQRERDDIAALGKATTNVPGLAPKVPVVPKGQEGTALGRYANDVKNKGPQMAADSLLSGLTQTMKEKGIAADQVVIYGKEIKSPTTKANNIGVTTTTTTGARGGKTTTSLVAPMDLYNSGVSTTPGTTFTDKNGQKWKISGPATAATGYQLPVVKAKYGVSGARGSVLAGEFGMPEIVDFENRTIIPADLTSSFINSLPNAGPRFNVPSNTISGVSGGANNSYNNNVYNIDIDLNGTNVTADDIMRKFKAELALINAKEGRSRIMGGNY